MDKAMEVFDLKKSYGNVRAVGGISFYVEKSRLFAFLGPNGAGKSTTIDILCTLLRSDGGSALIAGHELGRDDHKIRREIGVVFQDNTLDALLTVRENLYVRGGFYGLSDRALRAAAERAAGAAGVTDFLDRPYGKLSGGQRRRSDIARALVHAPHILFLDEPTTGLDPQTRRNVWDTIRALQREKGMTVFMTTHYMEEAAAADYVLIIDDGLIAAKGTPDQLRERHSTDTLRMRADDTAALLARLRSLSLNGLERGGTVSVGLSSTLDAIDVLERCRDLLIHFEVKSGSLDDAFIAVTGKEIRE